MEFVWSPWRYAYIASAGKTPRSCVFCIDEDQSTDAERLVLYRGPHCFAILNLFPYTSGHLMIAPYTHMSAVSQASSAEASEMMSLAQRATIALEGLYHPEGFNIGMNLGHCAGAGVKDHIHMHVVPRWVGDSSFMTVVGETRVLPEDLSTTYGRLKQVF